MIIIIIIIYNWCYGRMKKEEKIVIILCFHIYGLILIVTTIAVTINIKTLLGDLYKINFNTPCCILMEYLVIVLFCTLYHAFVNQAFYRLCLIVYSQYKRLQLFWFYFILPYIQLILSAMLFSPLLIWQDIVYVPKEHYCYVEFSNLRGSFWIFLHAYGTPMLLMSFIYVRITSFLRQQSKGRSLIHRRQQKRSLLVMRRIFINIVFLLALGIPGIVLLILRIMTNVEHPLSTRITHTFASLSITCLSISLVFTIPQLKNLLLKTWS